jgi:hypothetical protein
MLKKAGRLGILVALITISLVAIGWLIFNHMEVGMAKVIGIQEPPLSECEYSDLPQSVVDDATELAKEIIGDSRDRFQDLVQQILATYKEASDRDVVVVFNSGGWGWNLLEETPGWVSILDGIKAKLESLGYKSLVLNYRRTGGGLRGVVKEFLEAAARYPSKAEELAKRVEFLTDHIPNLKVIVAGESTGTVVTDKTMQLLRDNPRIYSIQTGTPFWHKPTALDRTLLMNSNGRSIDTFSYGNVSAVLWATVKGWFGLSSPEDNPGTILSWLRAPGHDYSWQYPGVSSEVVNFLEKNFGVKNR